VRREKMGMNYVINFCVDEDGKVYVEKVGLGEFGYVNYMLFGEMSCEVRLEGEERKDLIGMVGELIDGMEIKDVKGKRKGKKEMLEMLDKEINKELYELGRIVVKVFDWGVEYDNNVGVVVMEG
jgi:hypothetical protein